MTLHLSQGQVLRLQNVLYVPNLKKNLVSISAMEAKGFDVAFVDGKGKYLEEESQGSYHVWV